MSMKWKFFFIAISLVLTSTSHAQMQLAAKRRVATVLFSSLGGAVLGLSTLSFYGEPQEHTENISLGALVGFVAGLGYIAYDSSRPAPAPVHDYGTVFELDAKMRRSAMASSSQPKPTLVSYNISF